MTYHLAFTLDIQGEALCEENKYNTSETHNHSIHQ